MKILKMLKKLRPRDIIAIVIIISGTICRVLGADGLIGSMMITVTAAYFGWETIDKKFVGANIKKAKQEPVEDIIRRVAKEESVNPDLAVKVAKCESGLNPKAINKNEGGSIDRGVFQWNNKYHPEVTKECAFNPECATRKFCKAVKNDHLDWWSATEECWNAPKFNFSS